MLFWLGKGVPGGRSAEERSEGKEKRARGCGGEAGGPRAAGPPAEAGRGARAGGAAAGVGARRCGFRAGALEAAEAYRGPPGGPRRCRLVPGPRGDALWGKTRLFQVDCARLWHRGHRLRSPICPDLRVQAGRSVSEQAWRQAELPRRTCCRKRRARARSLGAARPQQLGGGARREGALTLPATALLGFLRSGDESSKRFGLDCWLSPPVGRAGVDCGAPAAGPTAGAGLSGTTPAPNAEAPAPWARRSGESCWGFAAAGSGSTRANGWLSSAVFRPGERICAEDAAAQLRSAGIAEEGPIPRGRGKPSGETQRDRVRTRAAAPPSAARKVGAMSWLAGRSSSELLTPVGGLEKKLSSLSSKPAPCGYGKSQATEFRGAPSTAPREPCSSVPLNRRSPRGGRPRGHSRLARKANERRGGRAGARFALPGGRACESGT